MTIERASLNSCMQLVKSLFSPKTAPSTSKQTNMPSNKAYPPIYPPLPIFVDIPDVDNALLCLSVLSSTHPQQHVNIILSPRPVDFRARRYDDLETAKAWAESEKQRVEERKRTGSQDGEARPVDFVIKELKAAAPPEVLDASGGGIKLFLDLKVRPLKKKTDVPTWFDQIEDDGLRQLMLQHDRGFKEIANIAEDTKLYMNLSAVRFANFLCDKGICASRFKIWWDEESMRTIEPAMRHSNHVPDYTYDFEKVPNLMTKYHEAVAVSDAESRRERLREVCQEYINCRRKVFEKTGGTIIGDYNQFLGEDYQKVSNPKNIRLPIIIGGPFTEALKYIWTSNIQKEEDDNGRQVFVERGHWNLPVKSITAMALYKRGDINVLPNQFNVACDIWAANRFNEVLRHIDIPESQMEEEIIPAFYVPTECIKDEKWVLTSEELKDIFKDHPQLQHFILTFVLQSSVLTRMFLYDWITAIVFRLPELFEWVRISPKLERVDGVKEKLLLAHEIAEDAPEKGNIRMCVVDSSPEFIAIFKKMVVPELKRDLWIPRQGPPEALPEPERVQ